MNSFSNIREPKPKVSPVSIKEPTLKEKQVTHQLLQHLESMNLFESPMESSQRERVLASLHEITQGWCRDTLLKKGFSENLIQDACPKLFTFGNLSVIPISSYTGSYRLGVHGPGADIDTLCVFPSQLERSDFFTTLFEKLNAMEEVTELTVYEEFCHSTHHVPACGKCEGPCYENDLFRNTNRLNLCKIETEYYCRRLDPVGSKNISSGMGQYGYP
eukprot:TRINITY_DN2419_c0_g1_i8.p1 TRINITY_DN2419_c0_g1~~TRINITY_DN2419_c0_g1_i8.p1  ORF type:complete len:217 (-),score=15.79 TRINITY_DN2419_c0_g1_i8:958-1608(-)